MTPRKTRIDEGVVMEEMEFETEDLSPATPAPIPPSRTTDADDDAAGPAPLAAPRPRPAAAPSGGRSMARFGIGALLMLLAVGLLFAGFQGDYYEVQGRQGPQPEGDADNSNGFRVLVRLHEVIQYTYRNGFEDTSPTRTALAYKEDAPLVDTLMVKLRYTGYIGAGLLAVAFVAALLHRFGALTVPGPAPVLAAFGVILLALGLLPFVMHIAHHARVEWIPGRLDLVPAFFTYGADGTQVHDLDMVPKAGFWLHTSGTLLAPVAMVYLFWNQFVAAGASLRRFADEAVVE